MYDDPSGVIRLPRRYAFRYLKFRVEAGSDAYRFRLKNICCDTTTSADWSKLPPPAAGCDGLVSWASQLWMALAGADTFWEVSVPSEPLRSPYLDPMINSHCHAWSTPVFSFR